MKGLYLSKKLTAILTGGFVLSLSILLCVGKKREFSEQENRYLSSFPKFSWEALKEGDFTADLESYLSDHFPFRDFFMGVKTGVELCLGRQEINGIYIAEDGYLIEKYKQPQNTEKIIRSFRGLKEATEQAEVYLMLVPTASCIYADKLPEGAPINSQLDTISQIYEEAGCVSIPIEEALLSLRDEKEPLYYRTDHHWTSYGAYVAYLEFCKAKGFEHVRLESLEKKVVTEEFKGTIYSKVNDYLRDGDAISIYVDPKEKLTVSYTDTKEQTDSLYAEEYLDKKDKYSYFLNNIHPLIEITNETIDTEEELVLIKDSYANCMVPFLIKHYKKIYVIDPRFYKEAASELINQNPKVKDVLLLYNMNTLDTDLGVGGIY